MEYYQQTQRLLALYDSGNNINILRHFFSQLQQMRGLISIPLVNAISLMQTDCIKNEMELIYRSITFQPYMKKIKIEDIRNVIVFLIRKEFKRIVKTEPYLHKNEKDRVFLSLNQKSTLGIHAKFLEQLIETSYYITHIYYIYRREINKNEWKMFHDAVNSKSLPDSVKMSYELIKCLIQNSLDPP